MSCFRGKYADELAKNAAYIGTPGKGILDAHELPGTIGKRPSRINVEIDKTIGCNENFEKYPCNLRELLFCTPGPLQYLSGVILIEETLYQKTAGGKPFVDTLTEGGVLLGIKVDKGTVELAGTNGETITQDSDDLGKHCAKYYEAGARFAKWRAVLKIGPNEPSELAIRESASGLARYASICQENGLVPIVELEIRVDGSDDIDECADVTERALVECFRAYQERHVMLEGTLWMLNKVTPGSDAPSVATDVIAEYTLRTWQRTVPVAVPAILFCSGDQSEEATQILNAMNNIQGKKPWSLSFSVGYALKQSTSKGCVGKLKGALKAWGRKKENVEKAQAAFLARAKANSEATLGAYEGDA